MFVISNNTLFFFFFFSSRRRHTRLTCDWSSDVCSSDLGVSTTSGSFRVPALPPGTYGVEVQAPGFQTWTQTEVILEPNRSEERRVGKECRSRWSPYH